MIPDASETPSNRGVSCMIIAGERWGNPPPRRFPGSAQKPERNCPSGSPGGHFSIAPAALRGSPKIPPESAAKRMFWDRWILPRAMKRRCENPANCRSRGAFCGTRKNVVGNAVNPRLYFAFLGDAKTRIRQHPETPQIAVSGGRFRGPGRRENGLGPRIWHGFLRSSTGFSA